MLFNIESDSGVRIQGYLVPDNLSGVPILRLCANGEERCTFAANEKREALVEAGRHETGRCGFSIDTTVLPDLANLTDVEIFDAETNLLVYRRSRPDHIKRKILRIETHLFPLWALDNAIASRFQYFAKAIENRGRESATQLFLLNHVPSVYLSGRILYRNFAHFIEPDFQTLITLQDPYEELAERLLVLSKSRGRPILGMRETVAFEPAVNFAEGLPLRDEKMLRRALRRMPDDVTTLLANPLVRQLTTTAPDAMPREGAIAAALDILANAALVGFRHQPGTFLDGLAALLDMGTHWLPQMPKFAAVSELANLLRHCGSEIDFLVEKDVELYHYVESSVEKAKCAERE